MDDILRCVGTAFESGPVSFVTAEVASMVDPERQERIENDTDEAIWEEMEAGLRHQSAITVNYLLLMALGGTVAAVGLVSPPGPQALYFAAASIIAPGLESLIKLPLILAMRDWSLLGRALKSFASGYALLMVASALTFVILQTTESASYQHFVTNEEIERIASPGATEIIVSVCGALAAVIVYSTYRRSVIAGPLMALVLIPTAAMVGMAGVAQRWDLTRQALERLSLDLALIVGCGALVFGLKQRLVHRRKSLA